MLKSADNPEAHSYRLIVVGFPSARVMVLRLALAKDGTAQLYAKEAPLDAATTLINKQETIPAPAVNKFLECVDKAQFWRLPFRQIPEPDVLDGSHWFLEGARLDAFHLVYRRAPEQHPDGLTEMGRYLVDLANLGNTLRIPRADRAVSCEPPVLVPKR